MLPAWLAVVVTSRPEPEIVAALAKYKLLEIKCGSTDNRADIERFVTHKVRELMGMGVESDEAVQLLCDKADGVFLYVAKCSSTIERCALKTCERCKKALLHLYLRCHHGCTLLLCK